MLSPLTIIIYHTHFTIYRKHFQAMATATHSIDEWPLLISTNKQVRCICQFESWYAASDNASEMVGCGCIAAAISQLVASKVSARLISDIISVACKQTKCAPSNSFVFISEINLIKPLYSPSTIDFPFANIGIFITLYAVPV